MSNRWRPFKLKFSAILLPTFWTNRIPRNIYVSLPIKKILIQVREILEFGKKWYVLKEILGLISGSLPDDQGGFTHMLTYWVG